MTEKQLRNYIVDMAKSFYGCSEYDGSHKKIIDIYNAHKPLARGYKVKYSDAWCATFVSAVAIKCSLTDIIPTECGCPKMIERFKAIGRWVEDDNYVPKIGDIMMYDFNDSGKGDNKGNPDHVGIVISVTGDTVRVLEGNYRNQVMHRDMEINGKYIRGYCIPDYASKATEGEKVAIAVDGKWGCETTRRLQEIFGTVADGEVSNQWNKYKVMNPGLRSGWDWQIKPNGKGSDLIRAMQKWAGMSASEQDGEIGTKTIKAFQKKLGTPVDGKISNPSAMVKALQKWANKQ